MRRASKTIATFAKLNDCKGDIDKQWFVYFSYRNPKSGKLERFKEYKGFTEHKTAEAKTAYGKSLIKQFNAKLKNGWSPFNDETVIYEDSLTYHRAAQVHGRLKSSNKNFRYYMSQYLTLKQPNIKQTSYETYLSKFRQFDEWLNIKGLENIEFSLFDYEDAKEFILYMQKQGRCGRTINEYLTLLGKICKELIKKKLMKENPFALVDRQKVVEKIPLVYKKEQIQTLKEVSLDLNPQMWLCEQIIYYTFVRPTEIRKLTLDLFDFDEGTIFVPAAISKNSKDGYVIMSDALLQWMKQRNYHKCIKEHFVFTLEGKPGTVKLGKNYFNRHFRKIRTKAEIEYEYKLYNLKHTGNLNAFKSGVSVKEIQIQNRHHSLDVTDRYLRAFDIRESHALRNAVAAI